jgi:hypothetical protein
LPKTARPQPLPRRPPLRRRCHLIPCVRRRRRRRIPCVILAPAVPEGGRPQNLTGRQAPAEAFLWCQSWAVLAHWRLPSSHGGRRARALELWTKPVSIYYIDILMYPETRHNFRDHACISSVGNTNATHARPVRGQARRAGGAGREGACDAQP